MKMKYHKIRKVPLDVCTCEQKIAYNIAFRIDINHGDDFRRQFASVPQMAVSDFIHDIIRQYIGYYVNSNYGTTYNIDAIFSCLNAGLEDYLKKPFIASDYEKVGKAFPAYYL